MPPDRPLHSRIERLDHHVRTEIEGVLVTDLIQGLFGTPVDIKMVSFFCLVLSDLLLRIDEIMGDT